MPARAGAQPLRYRPELDGVRAVAVYLVVAYHAGMATVGSGFVGVDLFFVLSGFLVSAVILRELDARGTIALGGFYARRVRRLLPAAVLVIVATALVQVLVTPQATRVDLVADGRAALLYVANWHFIAASGDYFAQGDDPSPYLHFWSLAIEEQFYILFPILVLAACRLSRRPVRAIGVAVTGLLVASLALQLWRAADDPGYAYYATETRAYQLAAGIALTLAVRWLARRPLYDRLARVSGPAALAGLLALLLVASEYVATSASWRGVAATGAAVLLLGGLSLAPRSLLARGLARPVPRHLGQLSYATYLWHWPVILVLLQVLDARPWVVFVLGAGLATALAALSGQLLEAPVRRSRRLDVLPGRGWPIVSVGLALSVLAALVVVPPALRADRRPALAATGGPTATGIAALDRPVPDGVDLLAAAQDVGEPTSTPCTVEDPTACAVADGAGPHVLLLGDSQAVSLTPALTALARDHDLTLSTNVQPGCPWQAGQRNARGSTPDRLAACTTARDDFLADVLPRMDVDLVLAVGLSRSDPYWESQLTSPDGPPEESLEALQLRTTRATAETITAAGSRLVIMHSVFGTDGYSVAGFDPIDCLSRARTLGECAVVPPLATPAVDGVYDTLAAGSDDVATIDVREVVCPDRPLCHPVKDGTVVWKDRDHVTATWYVDHRPAIWRRLVRTGLIG